ncbi:MAG: MmcQ/YjbR family DNA-binding protein [Chthoniobacterales bacterium]|nr:MmcQ/YjbR family DNA-binding protein [Chthoniobacterales bacterium]
MTAAQFRALALGLPETVESSHCDHPDFRVRNRIFATLGYPDARCGMVKLTPDQQRALLDSAPQSFRPAAGAWGRSGSTVVLLSAVNVVALRPLLRQAWENITAKAPRIPRRNRTR